MKVALFKKQKSDEDDGLDVIPMDQGDDGPGPIIYDDEPEFDFDKDNDVPTKEDVEDFADVYRIEMVNVMKKALEKFDLSDYVHNHKTYRKHALQRYFRFRNDYASLQALILLRRLVYEYRPTKLKKKDLDELKIVPLSKDDLIDIRRFYFKKFSFDSYFAKLDPVRPKHKHLFQIDGLITIIRMSLLKYFRRVFGKRYVLFENEEAEDDELMEEVSERDAENEQVEMDDIIMLEERLKGNVDRTLQLFREIEHKYLGENGDQVYELTNALMAYEKIIRDILFSLENNVPFNGMNDIKDVLGKAETVVLGTKTRNFQDLNALLIYVKEKKAEVDKLLPKVVSLPPDITEIEDTDEALLENIAATLFEFQDLSNQFSQLYEDADYLFQMSELLGSGFLRIEVVVAETNEIFYRHAPAAQIRQKLVKKFGASAKDKTTEELQIEHEKLLRQDMDKLKSFIIYLRRIVKNRADTILEKMQRVQENDKYHRMALKAVRKKYPNVKIPQNMRGKE